MRTCLCGGENGVRIHKCTFCTAFGTAFLGRYLLPRDELWAVIVSKVNEVTLRLGFPSLSVVRAPLGIKDLQFDYFKSVSSRVVKSSKIDTSVWIGLVCVHMAHARVICHNRHLISCTERVLILSVHTILPKHVSSGSALHAHGVRYLAEPKEKKMLTEWIC